MFECGHRIVSCDCWTSRPSIEAERHWKYGQTALILIEISFWYLGKQTLQFSWSLVDLEKKNSTRLISAYRSLF